MFASGRKRWGKGAPPGSLGRRRLPRWGLGSDSGRDPRIFCSSGRALDVGVVPRLLPASDHTARIVVGTHAVVNWWPWQEGGGCHRWGWRAAHVGLLRRWGVLYLGWFPPTVAHAASGTRCRDLSAVQQGALRLLNGDEFHQVSNLAMKVPLGRIHRLWQCLQEDHGRRDVLACTELLRELHAGVIDDVAVDPSCALEESLRGSS